MDQYEQNKWKLEEDYFGEYNSTPTFSGPVYSTQDCSNLFEPAPQTTKKTA